MSNNPNWKRALQLLIDRHNDLHQRYRKGVAHKTREERARSLHRSFALLRRLGYQLHPANLAGHHVQALLHYWTAGNGLAPPRPRAHGLLPCRPYSAAYIQQQLSFLRSFARWVGKPGMIRPAHTYVSNPTLVQRSYVAQRDKSWSAHDIERSTLIAKVAEHDRYVGVQLELMLAFGLRRKEAVMFRPHLAIVSRDRLAPARASSERYAAFLRIRRGTKGGRLRFAAIRNAEQEQALEHARQLVRTAVSHLGQPGRSLRQALKRFDYVVRRSGITRRILGITPHGLRHQFAGDLYFELAGELPRVRGGKLPDDLARFRSALQEVVVELGHKRRQISSAYLGSIHPAPQHDNQYRQETPQ